MLRRELVNVKGPTSIFIEAEITDAGHLLFSGQDVGKAPIETFGDSDYEYWLQINSDDKDRLLMLLIEQRYACNARVISNLMDLLKEQGILYEFHTYS